MFKRVGLTVGVVLLSIILLGYVFRLSLLQWAVAPQLEKAGVTLSCLDFSLTRKLNIYADKACLRYQNHQLIVSGITANSKRVVIEHAELIVSSAAPSYESNDPAKIFDLALPKTRPIITVNQLTINSPLFKQPLTVSINEPSLNIFAVTGDLNATAKLYNHKVQGQFRVNDKLIKQLLKIDNELLNDVNFKTLQAFSFNGVEAKTSGNLQGQYIHKIQSCEITGNTAGELSAMFNINSQKLELDLSKLKNNVLLNKNCHALLPPSDYKAYAIEQLPLNWQWLIAKPVSVANNKLTLPLLTLKSAEQQAVFTFTDTFVDTTLPLQSARTQLQTQIHTADTDTITLNAQFNNAQLSGHYDIALASLPTFLPVAANNFAAKGDFTLAQLIGSKPVGTISSIFSFDQVTAYGATVNDYTGKLVATMTRKLDASVTLKSTFNSAQYHEYQLKGVSNTLSANANLDVGELFANLTANTQINTLISPSVNLANIKVTSTGLQSRALQASHHLLVNGLELVANHHITKVEHPFEVIIPQQSVLSLNSLISQFEPLAQLTQGSLNGRIEGDVSLQSANFTLSINDTSALYNDYLANQFSTQLSGQFNSGQLNVAPTTFNINELRAGAVANNITGKIKVVNNNAHALDVRGDVFGGVFFLDTYSLLKAQQTTNVTFENIDASKLILLDAQSGITLTGRLKGTLPFHFDGNGAEITNGSLLNQGAGKLIISNNAAFDSIMQQQQELRPILGLLKNLDIQKLNSTVALKNDGWLNLGVNLQGFNETEQQQVNFNYNHEENVFTLLRALRLSDEITQKVEQQYSQKGN